MNGEQYTSEEIINEILGNSVVTTDEFAEKLVEDLN